MPKTRKGGQHGKGKQPAEAGTEEGPREEGREEAVSGGRHVPAIQTISCSEQVRVLSEVCLAASPGMSTERVFTVDLNGAKVLCVSVMTGNGNYNFTTVVVGKDGTTGSIGRIGFAPDMEEEGGCDHDADDE